MSTPEKPDDHDNPLRVAFGNEASDRDIAEFGRRFGCTVWDGFGSTENAVIITREDGCPTARSARAFPGVAIYDPRHRAGVRGRGVRRERGTDSTRDAAVGELVNTSGSGFFRGYYKDAGATDQRMRHGMYWSGDLAYRDADGWIYFAGRTADWMRVDGENLAAAPIERVLIRLPAISRVAVYPVPDESVGDQVMAAVVLRDGAELDPGGSSRSSWPPSAICRRRRGRATSGSPTICRAPRPTRSSSANSSPGAPTPRGGCCGSATHGSGVATVMERVGDLAQRHQCGAQLRHRP